MASLPSRDNESVDFTDEISNYMARRRQIESMLEEEDSVENSSNNTREEGALTLNSDDPYRTLEDGEDLELGQEISDIDMNLYEAFNTEGINNEENPIRNSEHSEVAEEQQRQSVGTREESNPFNFNLENSSSQPSTQNIHTQENNMDNLVGSVPSIYDDEDEMEEGGPNVFDNLSGLFGANGGVKKALIVLGAVLIVILVIMVIINVKPKFNKETVETVQKTSGVYLQNGQVITRLYANDVLEPEDNVYTDYLVVSKMSQNIMGSLSLNFSGTTTKLNIPVVLPVDLDTYNNTPSGAILQISFKVIVLDGETLSTDVKIIKEVS